MHLYSPLFSRNNADQTLSSDFLDLEQTKSLDASFTHYQLCIRSNLHFSDESPITTMDLAASLEDIHAEGLPLPRLTHVETTPACVTVTLAAPEPEYFDNLTVVASTLLKRGTENQAAPVGLGPYSVSEWGNNHLALRIADARPVAFSMIEFRTVHSVRDAIEAQMTDINLLNWAPERDDLASAYQTIRSPRLRSHMLIVSIEDPVLRKNFSGCFPFQGFGRQVLGLDSEPTPGLLPREALGSGVDFSAVQRELHDGHCTFSGEKPSLMFSNQVLGRAQAIEDFFARNAERIPVHVTVKDFDRRDMIDVFTKHATAIFPAGVDALSSHLGKYGEPSIFFDVFHDDTRFVAEKLLAVKALSRRAAAAKSRELKRVLYEQAHRELLHSGYVVPLGEQAAKLYYPYYIKNIVFSDPLISYPRIDKMLRDE